MKTFVVTAVAAAASAANAGAIPYFPSASDPDGQGFVLRIVNEGGTDAEATVVGVNGRGAMSEVVLTLPAGRALTVDAGSLESGKAHTSGMRLADAETKQTFAGDLLNLTLAAPEVNRGKGALDAFDWLPEMNRCRFADRVLQVRLKYGMTVDRDEAQALELVLAGCESTEVVKPECA